MCVCVFCLFVLCVLLMVKEQIQLSQRKLAKEFFLDSQTKCNCNTYFPDILHTDSVRVMTLNYIFQPQFGYYPLFQRDALLQSKGFS